MTEIHNPPRPQARAGCSRPAILAVVLAGAVALAIGVSVYWAAAPPPTPPTP